MRYAPKLLFLAFLAWLLDGLLQLRFHAWMHARLALTVALMFLGAALFYQQQPRR